MSFYNLDTLVYKFISVAGITFLSSVAFGQDSDSNNNSEGSFLTASKTNNQILKIEPLSIGDKVPDIEFRMVNYESKTAKLSDFRGKLIILDFWATWCAPCISKLPKLDSLQSVYDDKLQILLVNSNNTGDPESKVIEFFKKRKNRGKIINQLFSAVEDSIARKFFPHNQVPHYVWISPSGRVMAITSSNEITDKNILATLKGENNNLPVKLDFDPNKLLSVDEKISTVNINDVIHYSFFKKGRVENVSRINRTRTIRDKSKSNTYSRGKAMRNMTIVEMYKAAISSNKYMISVFNDKRIILLDSSLVYDSGKSAKDTWEKENLYTYDLVIPPSEIDSLYNFILSDLNKYSGYYGRLEKVKVKCLILVRTSTVDKLKPKQGNVDSRSATTSGKQYIDDSPIISLILWLNDLSSIRVPVLDETNYKGNISIQLLDHPNDLAALRKALQLYDLDLIEKEKEIEMFVLSKTNHIE